MRVARLQLRGAGLAVDRRRVGAAASIGCIEWHGWGICARGGDAEAAHVVEPGLRAEFYGGAGVDHVVAVLVALFERQRERRAVEDAIPDVREVIIPADRLAVDDVVGRFIEGIRSIKREGACIEPCQQRQRLKGGAGGEDALSGMIEQWRLWVAI